MNIVHVRTDSQIRTVETLARQIWRDHYIPIIGEAQVVYMLDRFQSREAIADQIEAGYEYYLITDDVKEEIGYFAFLIEEKNLFLSKIYVRSGLRGRGYGRSALGFIERKARDTMCSKIWLTVNKHNVRSIGAYKKCGFEIREPVVQDIGGGFVMDDYRMEKGVYC